MTTDVAKAAAFYKDVLGWTYSAGPSGNDQLASMGSAMIADLSPTQPGMPPHWGTHIAVNDLKKSVDAATRLGGTVVMPHIPVPGFGTMAIVKDPAGAVFDMFQGEG
jgi:predicted enzyme related to lactoylglutathione lyase